VPGAREQRARQRAADPLDPAVERKLALDQMVAHPFGVERAAGGGEDRQRDREVEGGASLRVSAGARLMVI